MKYIILTAIMIGYSIAANAAQEIIQQTQKKAAVIQDVLVTNTPTRVDLSTAPNRYSIDICNWSSACPVYLVEGSSTAPASISSDTAKGNAWQIWQSTMNPEGSCYHSDSAGQDLNGLELGFWAVNFCGGGSIPVAVKQKYTK